MDSEKLEKQKKKKNNTLPAIIIALALLSSASEMFGTAGILIIVAIIVGVVVISNVSKKRKSIDIVEKRYSSNSIRDIEKKMGAKGITADKSYHSHDRLSTSVKPAHYDSGEHWKQQLDGFLKNGLIDRKEYIILLNKYKDL